MALDVECVVNGGAILQDGLTNEGSAHCMLPSRPLSNAAQLSRAFLESSERSDLRMRLVEYGADYT